MAIKGLTIVILLVSIVLIILGIITLAKSHPLSILVGIIAVALITLGLFLAFIGIRDLIVSGSVETEKIE